jgi:DNA-binding CsgD family transcriptional regulator
MQLGSDPVADLTGLTIECRTRQEYEAARLEWLERVVGFEASYFGAASPRQLVTPLVSGVSTEKVQHCEARADRYWRDRMTLQCAALACGGVVADHDALSARTRGRMPFYREVVTGHGIRATAVALLRMRGRVSGAIFLGRTARGSRFGDELDVLRRALAVLALGDTVHVALAELPEELPVALDGLGLTAREQAVLKLLCRGWTNAQIAQHLGSSPRTVKNQVSAILRKTQAANRTQLTSQVARRQRLA